MSDSTYIDDAGNIKHYDDETGELLGWEQVGSRSYIYDEDDCNVSCPNCGYEELIELNGQCYCENCETYFSYGEIEDQAGCKCHTS